jgi:predicted DNA-binding protein
MLKAKKEDSKVAVSFRISKELYLRIKNLKNESRAKGYIFSVQQEIEKFLEKQVKDAEDKLRNIEDIKTE